MFFMPVEAAWLASVSLSRFLDALFSVTLLMRGRVTGDTATAAVLTYQRMQEEDPKLLLLRKGRP
jgi:hypothetical protein